MHPFTSFKKSLTLSTGKAVSYYSLAALETQGLGSTRHFPYSLKILLESLIRMQSHPAYDEAQVHNFLKWTPGLEADAEFPYMPSRVLLQDFTGVPCVVDLAALRSALKRTGHDPSKIEPQIPVDLVIEHSVQIDEYGTEPAFAHNLAQEFERNEERYGFLHWGQNAFEKLNVLPPGLGICHQVNMEYLASCVGSREEEGGEWIAFPDTLVGTDSHTTMVNSMGVLGWGVGGIEAEAAMLGQPIPMLIPKVTGMRLHGELSAGATPTDIALAVTKILREKGVVGRFVEFFGSGLDSMTLADRAPIANMAPEYGATMGFFPIDQATLDYLKTTGRSDEQVELVERYCKEQGLFRDPDAETVYDDVVELDLATIKPSVAGPKRPQDRVFVADLHNDFATSLTTSVEERGFGLSGADLELSIDAAPYGTLENGSVVIAAITSCTNTSNPSLLLGAGLLARNAVARGLTVSPAVKTSFAPGSRVVTEYMKRAGLLEPLEALGFYIVAYGCTTCIGNSGPLNPEIDEAIRNSNIVTSAVLSGNRNFEGRVHPLTKANYLMSPPLVVAYALKGTVAGDMDNDPIGTDQDGQPVYLRDLWPSSKEIQEVLAHAADAEIYKRLYGDIKNSSPTWSAIEGVSSSVFDWDDASTYIREPSFFDDFSATPDALRDITGAAVLGSFGDFITTDHISPAGVIPSDGPAEAYLFEHGVERADFNSFGSRRGNHEVMMRGTFANIRIRNKLVGREGGYTRHQPSGEELSIYDAAMRYAAEQRELIILAGKLYGAGSSRDWAAKGTYLLGARAVIAETFERIHRSNLVEMGVLPLEYIDGQNAESLGLSGTETYTISGIATDLTPGKRLDVTATATDGQVTTFQVKCRIDTPIEVDYYRHGGILQYVLRDVMQA